MKTYKVIKEFDNAKKGDIFTETENGTYLMERNTEDNNVSACYESVMRSYVSMELTEAAIAYYIAKGCLIEIKEEDECCGCCKLAEIAKYVDDLISTYEADHKSMLESFENGEVQPCVKVEAETVYYNLMKVLNSIKNKINE